MKRVFILFTLLICILTLNAKKLYFDLGMGGSVINASFKDDGYMSQSHMMILR